MVDNAANASGADASANSGEKPPPNAHQDGAAQAA